MYEERVEGSVTRLLAVFHSTDAAPVGPVRSARTSDIGDLSRRSTARSSRGAGPTTPSRSASASANAQRRRRRHGHRRSTTRAGDRPAPEQPDAQVDTVESGSCPPTRARRPPPPLFTYRAAGQAPAHLEPVAGGAASPTAPAPAPPRSSTAGTARAGPARRRARPTSTRPGVQVAPANVIVQFVALRRLGRERPVRHADPRGPARGRGRRVGPDRRRPRRGPLAASRRSTPSPPTPTSTATRSASRPAAPGSPCPMPGGATRLG